MQFSFSQTTIRKSHLFLVVAFLLVAAGAVMGFMTYSEYEEGLSSKDWLPAQGKVLSHSIKAERQWTGRMVYLPSVDYSYHVTEDEVLRGERYSFPDHVPSPGKDFKQLLKKIQVGNAITSYYDPQNKSHVTVVRGVRHAKYSFLFARDIAIAVLGVCIGIASQFSRKPD